MRTSILALAFLVTLSARVAAAEPPSNFVLHPEHTPMPGVYFVDRNGITHTLADFSGKVVLLNLWATSCVRCGLELLALDRLQRMLGGPSFEVIAVSIDLGGSEPGRFQKAIGIKELGLFHDPSAQTVGDLGVVELPTTLLIDRDGYEVGRFMGPAGWDEPKSVIFLRDRLEIRQDLSSFARELPNNLP